jgi:hypothetical protein
VAAVRALPRVAGVFLAGVHLEAANIHCRRWGVVKTQYSTPPVLLSSSTYAL